MIDIDTYHSPFYFRLTKEEKKQQEEEKKKEKERKRLEKEREKEKKKKDEIRMKNRAKGIKLFKVTLLIIGYL